MKFFFAFLLLSSCQSAQVSKFQPIDPPADYSDFIDDLKKNAFPSKNFGMGDYTDSYYKAVNNLETCSAYSKKAYDQYQACSKAYSGSAATIENLQKEKESLIEELNTWRRLKIYFWSFVVLVIIGNLIYVFRGFLSTLIKARLGI